MNYTRPNDPEHIDQPSDWLFGALTFARGLSLLLQENEGIVIALNGDAKHPTYPDATKVIVFKRDSQLCIDKCDDALQEGCMVTIVDQ